ncbi:uncharacterized protein GGS22DRAFT_183809 [Annulohypoxylon maeteangense]|uniref:uncharacterized protein n=1 Tax=Annulohypoxylon maeteangense TaxID=1927788 RepID=UPI002007463B|nr:uncharacterized protein GGS22DRAFT_183809 [Annulohypoxylon maeteangense]KAI0890465.1 hypothetical protein GGS22DRAFT_183809 [Annulohypoxylon maeteangense]
MSLPPWRRVDNPHYRTTQHEDAYQQSSIPLPPGLDRDYQWSGNANYPPPGLIRATMPKAISEIEYLRERRGRSVILDNSDISLFGDLAEYLESGYDMHGNHIMCDLTCVICCGNKLEMPTCVSPPRTPEEDAKTEPLCVLPCGHFFGAYCIEKWISTCRDEDRCSDCPVCRFPLLYEYCGHEVKLRHHDPRFRRPGQLPLTIPEGGCVPAYCRWCRVDYVKDLAHQMAQVVYPKDVPESAFFSPRSFGPSDFSELRGIIRSNMLSAFYHAEDAFDHW